MSTHGRVQGSVWVIWTQNKDGRGETRIVK